MANVSYSVKEELVDALLDEVSYANVEGLDPDQDTPGKIGWAKRELLDCLERSVIYFSRKLTVFSLISD